MPNRDEIVKVLWDLRTYVARPENDFSWSSWRNIDHALSEIDGILAQLNSSDPIPWGAMSSLLLPTGPAQELAESSGWGNEFIEIANKIDHAISSAIRNCPCNTSLSKELKLARDLGMDAHYAEVSIQQCSICEKYWLRYFYENEAFSRSGRWYLGRIPDSLAMRISADDARATLESLDQYFCGGSYFDGVVKLSSGPILLA